MKGPSAHPVWAEVSSGALKRNYQRLKRFAGSASLIPVVKADGYGLGAAWVARTLRAPVLAVMTPSEGAELRVSGFRGKILLLSPALGPGLRWALSEKLVPSVSSSSQLGDLLKEAVRRGRGVEAQVEVNTGMNRLGCEPRELPGLVSEFAPRRVGSPLRLAGVYTHFPRAADDPEGTRRAAGLFATARKLAGVEDLSAHASASAALVRHGAFGLSHARPGLSLYGADPIPTRKKIFSPVLSLKARVLQTRVVAAGSWLSYGRSYRTKKVSRLAVLGLGYADGWRRILTNRGEALIGGRRVPLVGRVCMDMVLADVTALPKAEAGDVATLIGGTGGAGILLEDVANNADTIPYEILTGLGRRVPRVPVS